MDFSATFFIDKIYNHSVVGRVNVLHKSRVLNFVNNFLGYSSIEGANSRYYLNGQK